MNMLIGVLCEVVLIVSRAEREDDAIRQVKQTILTLLQQFDAGGDGLISREDLQQVMKDLDAVEVLVNLEIDLRQLRNLEILLFEERDQVPIAEIMNMVLDCRGNIPTTVKDIVHGQDCVRSSLTHEIILAEKRLKQQVHALPELMGSIMSKPLYMQQTEEKIKADWEQVQHYIVDHLSTVIRDAVGTGTVEKQMKPTGSATQVSQDAASSGTELKSEQLPNDVSSTPNAVKPAQKHPDDAAVPGTPDVSTTAPGTPDVSERTKTPGQTKQGAPIDPIDHNACVVVGHVAHHSANGMSQEETERCDHRMTSRLHRIISQRGLASAPSGSDGRAGNSEKAVESAPSGSDARAGNSEKAVESAPSGSDARAGNSEKAV
eukprot:gnl/TRDRNA2_/TRDRNA2_175348_c2_seq6.p1 gnl/TRDRNA2_/TRDRNA2_175348_c2~~gnl/TRDRNA2_/TRDRNA2_175348_c2_seq6.p1  ORF type:complete len:376 (+),score=51.60 gnl/TRDRNA2_/TRDRNA2_175348_c2_seq6:2-1129(+)